MREDEMDVNTATWKPWHTELARLVEEADRDELAHGEVRDLYVHGDPTEDPRAFITPMHTVNALDFCGARAGCLMFRGPHWKRDGPTRYCFSYRRAPGWNAMNFRIEGKLRSIAVYHVSDFHAIP
jgi:hypothetical protein